VNEYFVARTATKQRDFGAALCLGGWLCVDVEQALKERVWALGEALTLQGVTGGR